jgi:hypothetical protein
MRRPPVRSRFGRVALAVVLVVVAASLVVLEPLPPQVSGPLRP